MRGANPSRRCSQSPQVASSGHSEIVSTSGSAKARRCSRFCSSRSKCGMRDESGSSSVSSRICRRYCSARPFRRRAQRSLPPMTADSTSSASHFHGARSVPATMAAGRSAIRRFGDWAIGDRLSVLIFVCAVGSESTPNTSSFDGTHESVGLAFSRSRSDGTWPSDRYSAKRFAEKFSAAQLSIARNARPAGCGRLMPRSKYAGIFARASACSSTPT